MIMLGLAKMDLLFDILRNLDSNTGAYADAYTIERLSIQPHYLAFPALAYFPR